jgi:hypothetical protein
MEHGLVSIMGRGNASSGQVLLEPWPLRGCNPSLVCCQAHVGVTS